MAGVTNRRKGGQTVSNVRDNGSFGSEVDSSRCGGGGGTFTGPMADDRTLTPPPAELARPGDVSVDAVYFGDATLDRRHTPAMLPWLMAGVRRRSRGQSVRLVVGSGMLSAVLANNKSHLRNMTPGHRQSVHVPVLFSHSLNTMTRFARILHHPACFSYLTRLKTELPFVCHVFQARDEASVRPLVMQYWKQIY